MLKKIAISSYFNSNLSIVDFLNYLHGEHAGQLSSSMLLCSLSRVKFFKMDKIRLKKVLLLTSLCVLSSSCVNLSKVNYYSTASLESVRKFEQLDYGFARACADKCEIDQLEKKQLVQEVCSCNRELEADSGSLVIYAALKGYFEGLKNLSDNQLTNYKLDTLAKVLKEGSFGDLVIKKETVDSFHKIASILAHSVTDNYRKSKLTKYIEDANLPIKILLNSLQISLRSNLSGKLEVKRERLKSYYSDLILNQTISAYERKQIIQEYSRLVLEIKKKENEISIFSDVLQKIAIGHQKLFDNRHKLNGNEFRMELAENASNINDLIVEFNKLKS